MSVRAKFKCNNKEGQNTRFTAVVSGSPENDLFFKYTPSGSLNLGCINEAANDQFEVGKEYYLDITPAE